MKTIAYLRVSKDSQDVQNQRHEILEYGNQNRLPPIDEWIEVEMSSRKSSEKRRIPEVLDRLNFGDTLIVSEISRLGRSTGEVISIIDELIKRKVRFIAVKQPLTVNGKEDMVTKVMKTVFGLLAELERDLISQRTKQALAAKKASGAKLGRPKGSFGVSKLDPKRNEIERLLQKRVSKAAIARLVDCSRVTLIDYIKTRGLG